MSWRSLIDECLLPLSPFTFGTMYCIFVNYKWTLLCILRSNHYCLPIAYSILRLVLGISDVVYPRIKSRQINIELGYRTSGSLNSRSWPGPQFYDLSALRNTVTSLFLLSSSYHLTQTQVTQGHGLFMVDSYMDTCTVTSRSLCE
jgi:hypothetical protein